MLENFETFKNNLIEYCKANLGEEYAKADIKVSVSYKNNDSICTSLTIRNEGDTVAPAFRLEELYEDYKNGHKIEEIFNLILKALKSEGPEVLKDFVLGDITHFNQALDHIIPVIINKNKNQLFLNNIPYTDINNELAVIYKIVIGKIDDMSANITINNEILERWALEDTDIRDIHYIAIDNIKKIYKPEFHTMEYTLGMSDEDDFEDNLGLMVIQPKSYNTYGASAVLDRHFMKEILDTLNVDTVYLIPSSVHEWLVIKDIIESPEFVLNMIKEVNEAELDKKDFLSDNLYKYNRYRGVLEIVESGNNR